MENFYCLFWVAGSIYIVQCYVMLDGDIYGLFGIRNFENVIHNLGLPLLKTLNFSLISGVGLPEPVTPSSSWQSWTKASCSWN